MNRIGMGIALVLALGLPLAAAAQATDRPEDRAALKVLLTKGTQALNTRKFDAIAADIHPAFHIITADARKHVGLDAFKSYLTGLFEGPNAPIKDFKTELAVDEDTRFIDDNTAVSYGTSKDTFTFKDGDVRTMASRWSAVTKKEGTGWKLVNVQFTVSILDNPVVEGAKAFARTLAIGVGVVALILGFAIGLLMRRKPRA
jgi:ketosteroid isomerase-like protein